MGFFLLTKRPKIRNVRVGSPARRCGGVVVNVKQITRHPLYNYSTYDYDFALLNLKEELKTTAKIKAATLPSEDSCAVEEQMVKKIQ